MQKNIKSFDGVRINYDIFRIKNKKRFLVFIHGLGGDLSCWKKERAFFHKKGIPTIAIDIRGHGKSDKPEFSKGYKLENFAKDIYPIIKKEKIPEFVLIGHCFGGMVTILFHKLHPKLAKSYVLISTTAKPQSILKSFFNENKIFVKWLTNELEIENSKQKIKYRDYSPFIGKGDWNVFRIYSDIIHTSLRAWILTLKKLAGFDGGEIIKTIKQKVLILEGEDDSVFDVKKAKQIHKLIKNSKLVIIPHANHILTLNNPKSIEKEILEFNEKL
ncbi:MAG: alpha/beta hydrolase [Nanoarchaeota archaeon]|nr:alpha/beta hydrolase [Nanoarchaeota archaeon]